MDSGWDWGSAFDARCGVSMTSDSSSSSSCSAGSRQWATRRTFWRVVGVCIWRHFLPARQYTGRHRSGSRLRGRFVGNVMNTSMLALSLEDSVCLSAQSARAATGPRACAEVAATLGFAESSENVVALSSDIGKLAFASFSPSSSSSSSSPSDSYLVLPGPDQLLSNAFCSTCISSFESDLPSAQAFPSPATR